MMGIEPIHGNISGPRQEPVYGGLYGNRTRLLPFAHPHKIGAIGGTRTPVGFRRSFTKAVLSPLRHYGIYATV